MVMISLIAVSVVAVGLFVALLVTEIRRRRAMREIARLQKRLQSGRGNSTRSSRAVRAVVGTALDTAAMVRDVGMSSAMRSSLEGLLRWSVESQSEIVALAGPDGSVSIAFSDIEDSTKLNDEIGDYLWVKILDSHDRLVRRTVDEHGGHIVKSQGDGFMLAFSTPDDAVRASLAIQEAIEAGDRRLRKTPIRVRVGVHCGTAIERDGDLFGRDVAHAARVAALASGGQVLVSDEVRQATEDPDIEFSEAQRVELKGLSGERVVWRAESASSEVAGQRE